MKKIRRNLEILLNNTTIVAFKIIGKYRCFFCDLILKDRQQLLNHNRTHMPCSVEDSSIKTLRGKEGKVSVDVSEMKCIVCSEELHNIEDVGFHLTNKHNLPYDTDTIIPFSPFRLIDFKCVVCAKEFRNFRTLTVHMKKKHSSQCNLCLKTFSSFALLISHIKSEHDLSNGGTCGFCKKKFNSKVDFIGHAGKCSVGDLTKTEAKDENAKSGMLTKVREKIAYLFNNTSIVPFKYYHRRIQCFYCPENFTVCEDFRTHSISEHPVCNARRDLEKYPLHHRIKGEMVIKVDSSIKECNLCWNRFDDLNSLLTHLDSEHEAKLGNIGDKFLPCELIDDQYPCPECGEEFSSFGIMFSHFNKEHKTSNRALCLYCGKSFHNDNALNLHTIMQHTGQNRYQCAKCDLAFIHKSKLKWHMGVAHDKKVVKCPHCSEMFVTQHAKMMHIIKHHNGGYKCTNCGASFSTHHYMTKHIRSVHLQERSIKCTQCYRAFFDKHGLNKHMLTHIGDKTFNCEYCDKTFVHRSGLLSHKNVHNDEKPFSCKVCDKKYKNKQNLKQHMNIHRPEPAYTCDYCGKKCSWKQNLRKHMRVHLNNL